VVFIPNHHSSPPLRPIPPLKFEAVTEDADVARIGVKEILGPVLGLESVVTERASDLEFKRPQTLNQQVRVSLALRFPNVGWEFV
jgi:hypothetical protein